MTERPTEAPNFRVHQIKVIFLLQIRYILFNTFLASGSVIKKQGRVTSLVIISFYFGAERFKKNVDIDNRR